MIILLQGTPRSTPARMFFLPPSLPANFSKFSSFCGSKHQCNLRKAKFHESFSLKIPTAPSPFITKLFSDLPKVTLWKLVITDTMRKSFCNLWLCRASLTPCKVRARTLNDSYRWQSRCFIPILPLAIYLHFY